MNGDYTSSEPRNDDADEGEPEEDRTVDEQLRYDPNMFIACRTEEKDVCDFWIARILRVVAGGEKRRPRTLFVRWYIVMEGSEDEYIGRNASNLQYALETSMFHMTTRFPQIL